MTAAPRTRAATETGARGTIRLGPGEYADALTIARYGRALFFEKLPADVLRVLLSTCRSPYRELVERRRLEWDARVAKLPDDVRRFLLDGGAAGPPRILQWHDLLDPDRDDLDEVRVGDIVLAKGRREQAERTRELREALLAVTDRWPVLRVEWALDAMLFTLYLDSIGAEPHCLVQPVWTIRGSPWWDPERTDEENHAACARWGAWKKLHRPEPIPGRFPDETEEEFHRRLSEREQEQNRAWTAGADAAGLEPTPELRRRLQDGRSLAPDRHVAWTVRHCVLRDTYEEIAEAEGVTCDAVRKGVRKFAELIGLPRR